MGLTPTARKEIVYDRETRDYAMYLDGELVGFARTYHEGEVTLDHLVFELITAGAAGKRGAGMRDITTRCHSCARPIETEVPADELAMTFTQYGRPYFELLNTEISCSYCGRWHGKGFSMEIVEVQS